VKTHSSAFSDSLLILEFFAILQRNKLRYHSILIIADLIILFKLFVLISISNIKEPVLVFESLTSSIHQLKKKTELGQEDILAQ